jgi:hypothetical protein
MRKNRREFIYSLPFLALFLAPVLHKEFVGAKSDKLLGAQIHAEFQAAQASGHIGGCGTRLP